MVATGAGRRPRVGAALTLVLATALMVAALPGSPGDARTTAVPPDRGAARTATARASADGPPATTVEWRPCYRLRGLRARTTFECATVPVPLDHGDPSGGAIGIALVRIPAGDPTRRIGAVLTNPGGPGGSGVDFVLGFGPAAGDVWGPEVPARFDLVGFDPRGIGRSEQLRCFRSQRQFQRAVPPFAFPTTPDEVDRQQQFDRFFADQCVRRAGAIRDHVSTANVARDMDLLREALGDEELTYVGGSYGTYLGVTYANLFPERVRALVLDGVLDPVAWANIEGEIPSTTRLRSDEGAAETLHRFFALCDAAGDECALAPSSQERFDALAAALRAEPVDVPAGPDTTTEFGYDDLIVLTLGSLYDPFSYEFAADFLAELEQSVASTAPDHDAVARRMTALGDANPVAARVLDRLRLRRYVGPEPIGVLCEDANNPRDDSAWPTAAAAAEEQFGYFGPPWTWISSPCAVWPFVDPGAYRGPYDATTANSVLLLSTLYDPATRLEGAQTVRSLLPASALVTVDMPAHTTLGVSACAAAITAQYLLTPEVADHVDGTQCPQEFDPFLLDAPPQEDGAPQEPGVAPDARRDLLEQVVLLPLR